MDDAVAFAPEELGQDQVAQLNVAEGEVRRENKFAVSKNVRYDGGQS